MTEMKTNANTLIDDLGGTNAVARMCDVKPPSVTEWKVRGIPQARCPDIEFALCGAKTCEELRPDIRWVRIPDKTWPHPKGRPLVDHSAARHPAVKQRGPQKARRQIVSGTA